MRQSIPVASSAIAASITIPGSKSITNRALLLASLARGVSHLKAILLSDDTRVFIKALQQLGVEIRLDENTASCQVTGKGCLTPAKNARVWCQQAGTAARFLVAVCAASDATVEFDADQQLRGRPLLPLLDVLRAQGADISADRMPFTVQGKNNLPGGEIMLPGDQSSQFVSAMLMAAPLCKNPLTLITQDLVSTPYVAMTCRMMADFGVNVLTLVGEYNVIAPQQYMARDYMVEADLSTASYFFAAAAITGGVISMQPVDRAASLQADVAFLTVLEQMGCEVSATPSALTVRGPAVLQGVTVDMKDFSDTFMTLAAIACFAATPTIIKNIGHTRLQESDRISAMYRNLQTLGIKVETGGDWIKILPGTPKAAVLDSFNDHRIAMSLAVIGLRTPGIEIESAECVAKTCPTFFKLLDFVTAVSPLPVP
jgi:3-phosphoshikimate 1-carboxyvinyltransferase